MGRASRTEKSATEQPGNSFRYLYWRLSDHEFQQLCGALLKHKFDPVRCFAVGMADRGADAISHGAVVYQVKWSSKLLRDPSTWLRAAIEEERENIVRLKEEGASRYILMTSVAGTTTANNTGSAQKLEVDLRRYTKEFGIPVECWWQADIDAEVDAAPDAIKWSYQEMLAGTDAIRYLMEGSAADRRADAMRTTMLNVMGSQWRDDSRVKFSQLDLDRVDLVDLFVDVEASLVAPPTNLADRVAADQNFKLHGREGAASHLLKSTAPLTYVLGVPGQGKSTLSQYLCQAHRAAILPGEMYGEAAGYPVIAPNPKMPLRVDLKDFASWLDGRNPFVDEDDESRRPRKKRPKPGPGRSLEQFLALFCKVKSGGRKIAVEEVQDLLQRYPCLLVLDGLDEVAEPALRRLAVEQINALAMKMGGQLDWRQFQVIVTSRPNAMGLPEPDPKIFQTLQLDALSATLQKQFVDKWADVHNIRGTDLTKLRRTFRNRSVFDHVAQLADNPMQLTILLHQMHRNGDAVPVARTELYTQYLDTLLSREVNKEQISQGQVEVVTQSTAFLGWHIQSGVEVDPSTERLSRKLIENALILYLREVDGPWAEVADLVRAATDRLWALSGKIEGTFEFVVQPVKEYFAARFLAQWAGLTLRNPLPQDQLLRELINRPYWLNTARFYAGFANPNELAGLRYGLEDAIGSAAHPLQQRTAVWTLLNDGIFSAVAPVQRDVVKLLTDDLSLRLIADGYGSDSNFPLMPNNFGAQEYKRYLLTGIESQCMSPSTRSRAIIVRKNLGADVNELSDWWREHLRSAIGTPNEVAWLKVGEYLALPRFGSPVAHQLTLDSPEAYRAALSCGATPVSYSKQGRTLIRAVLDGHCSDVSTSSTSEAGALLKAVRPQWVLQHPEENRHGPATPNDHFWLKTKDRSSRSASFKILAESSGRYDAIRRAANVRARGQKGTTEPWQNLAREIALLHGPCWLAADIAVAGASTQSISPEGTFDPGGEPLGKDVDYGTLVMTVRRGPKTSWWQEVWRDYNDELSRRTWCFALIAAAPEPVVLDHLDKADEILSSLDLNTYAATCASTSRLGVTEVPRRLSRDVLAAARNLSPKTLLVVSHFASSLDSYESLAPLTDDEVIRLASVAPSQPASWPVARDLTARMIIDPSKQLLDALKLVGPTPSIVISPDIANLSPDLASDILTEPAEYPLGWLQIAEYVRSQENSQGPLRSALIERGWVPDIVGV